jgi:hypothetical protein
VRYTIITDGQFDRIDFTPTVVICFFQSGALDEFRESYRSLRTRFPRADIFGCTSASNVLDTSLFADEEVKRRSLFICMDIRNDAYRFTLVDLNDADTFSFDGEEPQGAILLSSAYSPSIEILLEHLPGEIGSSKVFGAIAGTEDWDLGTGKIFFNGEFYERHLLMWLIDLKHYELSGTSLCHFRPAAFDLEVTEARDTTLYMLNNRPALGVLEEMIGELLDEAIASFNHPFFLTYRRATGPFSPSPLCSIKSIDRKKQSIRLFRNVYPRDRLQLGISLSREEQMRQIKKISKQNGISIFFNCIGIKKNLSMMEHLFLVDIKRRLKVPFGGFHSFGEIGTLYGSDKPVLHNQAISILVISEKVS